MKQLLEVVAFLVVVVFVYAFTSAFLVFLAVLAGVAFAFMLAAAAACFLAWLFGGDREV